MVLDWEECLKVRGRFLQMQGSEVKHLFPETLLPPCSSFSQPAASGRTPQSLFLRRQTTPLHPDDCYPLRPPCYPRRFHSRLLDTRSPLPIATL